MRIDIEDYNPEWKNSFSNIQKELNTILKSFNTKIEHIGSTSIEGLSAKPIIDILIGIEFESDLDGVVEHLLDNGYIYYQNYNLIMPYRRFFVKLKNTLSYGSIKNIITNDDDVMLPLKSHRNRLAHIHILQYNSKHWIRHIAFRDYLSSYPQIKEEYQKLKENLSKKEWIDGDDYNSAKEPFIKQKEYEAIKWFLQH
ncbi:GrpB family protein [bacterium]|nr:GrpB family protein [bacterium]